MPDASQGFTDRALGELTEAVANVRLVGAADGKPRTTHEFIALASIHLAASMTKRAYQFNDTKFMHSVAEDAVTIALTLAQELNRAWGAR